jgi:hypothetical protein
LGLYFLKVGLQIGFGGFDLQASTGVALTAYVTRGVIIAHSQKKKGVIIAPLPVATE